MADRTTLRPDAQFLIACPGCGQRYRLGGLQVQALEEMACTRCNTTFRLDITGNSVKPVLIHGPTGSLLGPAETPMRQ